MAGGVDDYGDDRDRNYDDERGRYRDRRDYDIRRRPPSSINNYLVPAILCTLFCCLPFGIVAIVYAAQVNAKLSGGDYDGAESPANQAKTWCWVSFGLGLAGIAIYALVAAMEQGNRGGFR